MSDAHGHGHAHAHPHAHGSQPETRRLALVLVLVSAYALAEAAGGILGHSLALLADAGHMVSDAGALALALFAGRMARRPPDSRHTYGYHRAEVLAALANGAALILLSAWILFESWQRLLAPSAAHGGVMTWVAVGGLAVNVVGLGVLHGGHGHSLNLRGAWLHLLGDTLGSVGAIAAGVLVSWRGWQWADPAASALIALFVVHSSWGLLREAVRVLMEGAPAHLDTAEVRSALLSVPGVAAAHDLHVWTVSGGLTALSVHVAADEPHTGAPLLREISRMLHDRFGVEHATIQLEPAAPPGTGVRCVTAGGVHSTCPAMAAAS